MIFWKLLSVLVLCSSYGQIQAAESACGLDWHPFKEEKCIKVFDKVGLETHEDAEKTCQQEGARLISITFREKQEFLSDLLFNKIKIVDNVWIGAKYESSKFKWNNNSDLIYTNWASGSPKNLPDYCVQMHSDVGSVGKWVDEPCKKKNVVVCQKRQTWTLAHLQDILLEVKQNPVPIGFVYVQLPNEKAPIDIWPWMIWKDISSAYAGVFFRVEGGGAASFGQVQEDNTPRLSKIGRASSRDFDEELDVPRSGWSKGICIAGGTGNCINSMYYGSGGEVRPRNMAIRVWKRAS